jgi:transcriptional regulator of acetoin/glycerol metabolism
LRVLQEKTVLPIGESAPVPVDVRFVATTHRDLGALRAAGAFRDDLYARLAGAVIELPPLADRREDVGWLVRAILSRIAGDRAPAVRFERRAARALFLHDWPMDVRELEQALHAALALSAGAEIELGHLPKPVRGARWRPRPAPPPLRGDALKAELARLLGRHAGNVTAVARAVGASRQHVHRWLRQFGLRARAYRRPR